jgi:hypothetical protein
MALQGVVSELHGAVKSPPIWLVGTADFWFAGHETVIRRYYRFATVVFQPI